MKKTMRKFQKVFDPRNYPFAMVLVAVVLYLSFFTPPTEDVPKFPGFDKIVHVGMYGALAGTLWLEYLYRYRSQFSYRAVFLLTWLMPVLLSGLVEIGQECLTDNRSGDILDFCANMGGATLAFIVGNWVVRPRWR